MSDYWREFRVYGKLVSHAEFVILEIHHGGQFVDSGGGKYEYKGGEMHWLENIDPEKFAWTELNTCAWRLGYRLPPVHYWYKHHAKAIYLSIRTDKECCNMLVDIPQSKKVQVYFVGGGVRNVEVCEKEDESGEFDQEVPHIKFLPEITMVPLKAVDKWKGKVNSNGETSEVQDNDDQDTSEPDEEEIVDEEFVDSDYEINPEDDCDVGATDDIEFNANVDDVNEFEEAADMGFGCEISDNSVNTDEFPSLDEGSDDKDNGEDGSVSSKRKKRFKGKQWIPDRDMKNPHFELGQQFDNVDKFREAVRHYSVLNRQNLYFQFNTRSKVVVVCGKKQKGKRSERKCPFWLYAGGNNTSSVLTVRTCDLIHKNCSLVAKVHMCSASYLAKTYKGKLKADPNMSRKAFMDTVQDDLRQNITVKQFWRTKFLAKKLNEGSEAYQYNLLQTYANVLKETNPGTTVNLMTEMDGNARKFKRMYICFDACRRGWLKGCRPIIGLDGCHIKGQYPGQLLSAIGIDANNGMFPIAFAIVELENFDSWTWFVGHLMEDLNINTGSSIVFMSDKQKGLLDSVKKLLPEAEHRHCVRHMYNNFKNNNKGHTLKNLVWAAARDTTEIWFNKHYEAIKKESLDAWKWLERHESPGHWTRSHFRTHTKCDMLLNNLCEAFNASIVPARDKPILGMFEEIRVNLMTRLANRRCAGLKWKTNVGPRIQKILEKNAARSYEYRVTNSSDYVYEVNGTSGSILQSQHVVDLASMTCTCQRWTLSGIPCPHAIACIFVKGHDPAVYLHPYYSKEAYMHAYAYPINPVPGVDLWKIVHHPIEPPPFKRQPGRPKKVRRKEEGEAIPASQGTSTTTNILSRKAYVSGKCSICGNPAHNKRTCSMGLSKGQTNEDHGRVIVNVENQENSNINVLSQNQGNHGVNMENQENSNINVLSQNQGNHGVNMENQENSNINRISKESVSAAKKQVKRAPIKASELSLPSSSQLSMQTSTFQLNTRGSSTQPGHFMHPVTGKLNRKDGAVNGKKTWKY